MLSELQITLIGAGLTAVAGVWGYNSWQGYRQRKLAERIVGAEQEDVLMQGDSAGKESAPITGDEFATAPRRIEPVFASSDESNESNEIDTATEPGDSEPPAELADDFIDCIVRLEAAEMVAAPLFWAAQRQIFGALEDHLRWSGLDENSGQWRQIRAHDATSYRHLRAALQVADRNGPIGEAELARFYDGVGQLAENFQVAAEYSAASVVLAHARALDEFCASVDWRISVNVVNLAGQTVAAARLIDLATETSLWLKDDGVFHAEDAAGQTVFTLSDLGGKPFADGLGSLSLNGVTLSVDVPRVADGSQAFDRLLDAARKLMTSFDGTLVDDRRTPLSDEMLATIRGKIEEFQAKMSAHQIPAGGRRALRLYS
ncbi:MAG: ZipA [Proteobacteria bacterium]|nr:ZipA [Pseudomonadota bacterium]